MHWNLQQIADVTEYIISHSSVICSAKKIKGVQTDNQDLIKVDANWYKSDLGGTILQMSEIN